MRSALCAGRRWMGHRSGCTACALWRAFAITNERTKKGDMHGDADKICIAAVQALAKNTPRCKGSNLFKVQTEMRYLKIARAHAYHIISPYVCMYVSMQVKMEYIEINGTLARSAMHPCARWHAARSHTRWGAHTAGALEPR